MATTKGPHKGPPVTPADTGTHHPMSTIPANRHQVKAKFLLECERLFDRLLGRADHPDIDVVADLERLAAAGSAELGRDLLGTSLARACEAAMEQDIEGRGLDKTQIRLRMEKDYFAALSTTLGLIVFPWFAYRSPVGDVLGRGFVTRNPARALLPYYGKCRSSPVCLEWEARLGARDAFRKAQEMLNFVTRGALKLEDTTIERHMVAAARLIDPSWLYRKPGDIRSILADRATRDLQTGRPLLYASTDGHALRRYVGDTWAWGWRVVNGIRLWCEDARTGRIIHIGGEFTWGDCRCVAGRFSKLLELGILPNDEPEWKSIDAQLVFLSDGAEWIVEHVLPVFRDTFVILDPFHVVGWFAGLGAQLFGAGTNEAKLFHGEAWEAVFGEPRVKQRGVERTRRGHKKKPRNARTPHLHDRYRALLPRLRKRSPDATSKALLNLLATAAAACDHPDQDEAITKIMNRLTNNVLRMKYPTYLKRGFQVGSGAMESLHRSASQARLKRSGRWQEETSLAVLNFRMLELSGRWGEFWCQRDLPVLLQRAFAGGLPADDALPQPAEPDDATESQSENPVALAA